MANAAGGAASKAFQYLINYFNLNERENIYHLKINTVLSRAILTITRRTVCFLSSLIFD